MADPGSFPSTPLGSLDPTSSSISCIHHTAFLFGLRNTLGVFPSPKEYRMQIYASGSSYGIEKILNGIRNSDTFVQRRTFILGSIDLPPRHRPASTQACKISNRWQWWSHEWGWTGPPISLPNYSLQALQTLNIYVFTPLPNQGILTKINTVSNFSELVPGSQPCQWLPEHLLAASMYGLFQSKCGN